MREDRSTESIPTANEKWAYSLWLHPAGKKEQNKQNKTRKRELQLCLALNQMNTLLGMFDQRCRETKHIQYWTKVQFEVLLLLYFRILADFFFYTHLIDTTFTLLLNKYLFPKGSIFSLNVVLTAKPETESLYFLRPISGWSLTAWLFPTTLHPSSH